MLPRIGGISRYRRDIPVFGGLRLSGKRGENEFSDMNNMSADGYPALSTRQKRAIWYGRTTVDGRTVYTEGVVETDGDGITAVACVCDRLVFCAGGRVFVDGEALDGVTLTGGGRRGIVPFGRGFLLIPDNILVSVTDSGATARAVEAPLMDFAVTRDNRVYGCRSGPSAGGETVNELYVCKQGDASAWYAFDGLSTDSYAAATGAPGPFTGIAVCGDRTVFFKEDAALVMSGSRPSEYAVAVIPCEGPEEGAADSVVNVGNEIFYKSRGGITAFDGASSRSVSEALGVQPFTEVSAGAINNKYYAAMTLGSERSLYALDLATGLWHRESCPNTRYLVRRKNCLIMVNNPATAAIGGARIRFWTFAATDARFAPEGLNIYTGGAGEYLFGEEADFPWLAKSGRIYASGFRRGRLRELRLRLSAEKPDTLVAAAYLNGSGTRRVLNVGREVSDGLATLRCRLPACDFLELELSGEGACEVYSAELVYTAQEKSRAARGG